MSLHTVFSISQQPYQIWQAELLAYSHHRARQLGPLTCLVSTNDSVQQFPFSTFTTPARSPHPDSGDDYAPYNKPFALSRWTFSVPPDDDQCVLVIDPDCVFLRRIEVGVTRGRPRAQSVTYMHAESVASVLRRHGANPAHVQSIAVPMLIHHSDLTELAPLWCRKTEELRSDPVAREQLGWITEMWGCAIAAAELGLRFDMDRLCAYPTEDEIRPPIIHYCYSSTSADGSWRWDKRTYRPWDLVPLPPTNTPEAAIALAALLNEFVAVRSSLRP